MPGLWRLAVIVVALIEAGVRETGSHDVRKIRRDSYLPRANIIFVMADDLDVFLNSTSVLKKTKRILRDQGVTFKNAFTTSPLCCPSRSSILTGRYAHNHHVNSNNRNCSSAAWIAGPETENVGKLMRDAGYRTAYFGKYLNNYDGSRIPPGWDQWVGLLRNSRFYNYTLNINGRLRRYRSDYAADYFTNVVADHSIKYFTERKRKRPVEPIFMVVSMAAPHGPEDAAPHYQDKFPDVKAPRFPNYNHTSTDKHWIIRNTPPLTKATMKFTDVLYRKRLQTLLSLDDIIERLYTMLIKTNQLRNTYFVFSSDHGYHLGQFNQVKGKAQPYEADIRVPLYMRGPKIPSGVEVDEIALNIDLTPTFLDIANSVRPKFIDGTSLMDVAVGSIYNKIKRKRLKPIWRDTFLVERGKKSMTAPKDVPVQRYVFPAKPRKQRSCPTNAAPPPCNGEKRMICYFNNGLRILERCQKTNTSGSEDRQMKKACFRKYPYPPCTSQKKFVCYYKDNKWYLKRCPQVKQQISTTCTCTSQGELSSSKPSSRIYNIHNVLFQLERRFKRLKRRIKRHGVSYYLRRLQNSGSQQGKYVVLASRGRPPVPPRRRLSSRRRPLPPWGPPTHTTVSTSQVPPVYKFPNKRETSNTSTTARNQRTIFRQTSKTLKNERKTWTRDREKLSYNRALTRTYMQTLINPIKKRKPSPWSPNNSTQYCTCIGAKRTRTPMKMKKKKKAGPRGRDMNCFLMTRSHWKTPPYWDGPDFTACTNTPNSTYWCLRTINKTHNFLYCEFITGYKEYFDMTNDPYQLNNVVSSLPHYKFLQLHKLLLFLKSCKGSRHCFVINGQTFDDRKDILRKWRRFERKKRNGLYIRSVNNVRRIRGRGRS